MRIALVLTPLSDANLRLAPIARERSHALAEAGVDAGAYLLLTLHREANVRADAFRVNLLHGGDGNDWDLNRRFSGRLTFGRRFHRTEGNQKY